MGTDNQEIDDVLAGLEAGGRKKKVNSGDKGDRTERKLCKILSARFGRPFERAVGSGNRWSQVKELTASARNVLVGDVVCPEGFLWVLECKGGYEADVDLSSLFVNGNKTIDKFIEQVAADSARSGKDPMLLYKRNLRPWLCGVPTRTLPADAAFGYRLVYRDWSFVALERVLELPEAFFFVQLPDRH